MQSSIISCSTYNVAGGFGVYGIEHPSTLLAVESVRVPPLKYARWASAEARQHLCHALN